MRSANVELDPAAEAELSYLKRRVFEEASAAVRAPTISATLIHVMLATAYAKRLGEQSGPADRKFGDAWVSQNRVW